MSEEARQFDYIVVGAGSAGAIVAARLSEDGRYRVLLLEAGAKSNFWSSIPVGFAKLIENPLPIGSAAQSRKQVLADVVCPFPEENYSEAQAR